MSIFVVASVLKMSKLHKVCVRICVHTKYRYIAEVKYMDFR